MQVPKRRSELHRKFQSPAATDAYLTPEAIERLKAELARLEPGEQKTAIAEVTRTKEMGDLSENAAYTDAKFNLRRINDRIFSIKERLKRAIVIPKGGSDAIRVGSTVVLRINGEERTYEIVGSQETNPARGRISHLSPIGMALMSHKAGDVVTREINGKETVYEIIHVT